MDGLPSIDDPSFVESAEVDYLADGEPVFGVVHDGLVKADSHSEEAYYPAKLPLDSIVRFDALWFAWYGFYPETEIVS